MSDMSLLTRVLANEWIGVKAMVPPQARDVLLDVVFITTEGAARLIGRAHSLRDTREEAFSLAIYEHVEEGWWKEDSPGQTAWKPRNLRDEWISQSLRSILTPPRDVLYYSDPRLRERVFPAQGFLDNYTAIEFVKDVAEAGRKRIVISASDDDPCAIEVGTTSDRCDAILSRLVRLVPGRA